MGPFPALVGLVIAWLLLKHAFLPLWRHLRRNYMLRNIPYAVGPTGWITGHLLQWNTARDIPLWRRWLNAERRIMRFRIFNITDVELLHPETASVLLKTPEPKSEYPYNFLQAWIGNGLVVSSGKRWSRDRRLLTRAFHFDVLRGYFPVYKQAATVMLDRWAELTRGDGAGESAGDSAGDGGAVNVTRSCKLLMLDITLQCIMSFTCDCQLSPEDSGGDERANVAAQYAKAVHEVGRCLFERFTTPLQFSDFLFGFTANGRKFHKLTKFCHTVGQQIIAERRRALSQTGNIPTNADDTALNESTGGRRNSKYLDFIQILLTARDEDGKGLTDREIQDQVNTFLVAGLDTTSSALQWTLYYLAKHPHLQEKCRKEVQHTLDDTVTKDITYEHLGKLQYLTQFIKESIRLGATVPYITRKLTKPLEVDGHIIPKGTNVTVPIIALHRNPDVWENPEEFDPERFTPENIANRHPFAFVPFSAGPRNCIGQTLAMEEIRTIISLVLLRFHLTYDASASEPELMTDVVSRAVEDIKVFAHEI